MPRTLRSFWSSSREVEERPKRALRPRGSQLDAPNAVIRPLYGAGIAALNSFMMAAMSKRDPEHSVFYRLGHLCYRNRKRVLIAWILALVILGPQLGAMTDRMSSGGFEKPGSQSDRVTDIIQTRFSDQFQFSDLLVMQSDTLQATDPEFKATFEEIRAALSEALGVGLVVDAYENPARWISKDGSTLTAQVGLTDDQDQALVHVPELDAAVASAVGDAPVQAILTGSAVFYRTFQDTTVHDLERAEAIALPIALLILLVAFGSVVAAGMPLALALGGLAVAFGFISILANITTVSIFTQNLASMIGLGVGVDFALFIVTRFKERLHAGGDVGDAVAGSIATSGKAVFVSAMTTFVALSGTLLVDLAAFRSMGMGAMIAVAVACLAALTLLPALLGFAGPRIDSLRIGRRRERSGGFWRRWSAQVMKRPWTALIASLLVIAVLTAPALDLRMASSGASILPEDSPPRVAAEITAEAFGEGQVAPAQVIVSHSEPVLGEGFDEVYAVAQQIARDPEVVRIDSIATLVPGASAEEAQAAATSPEAAPLLAPLVADETFTLMSVVTRDGAQSVGSTEMVRRQREAFEASSPGGVEVLVGGDPGLELDIKTELAKKLPWVVGLVLLLSFFVLLVFLRSLLLPLKAILLNLASVTAAYGLLVLVFQKGYGEELLGFESTGGIEPFLPLFLFCILFGLSMDYEVFLLSRIKEEYTRTGDNTEAVGWGLEHTGRIITSAAAIMIAVFGGFVAASLVPIKAMGFGLAAAVFIDATLIRIVLVPASMRLMGDWNWYLPAWIERLLPDLSLEAGEEVAAEPDPAPVVS